MQETSEIIDKCKKSIYKEGEAHWSFPYEFRFVNKVDYLNILTNRQLFEDLFKKDDDHMSLFIENVTPNDSRVEFKRWFMEQVYLMFKHDLRAETYDTFLQESVETIDVYGVGLSFLFVLNKFASKMDSKLVIQLRELFSSMITPRVSERISADKALKKYEEIIGDPAKYNRQFMRG
jgi:hypothetical protein